MGATAGHILNTSATSSFGWTSCPISETTSPSPTMTQHSFSTRDPSWSSVAHVRNQCCASLSRWRCDTPQNAGQILTSFGTKKGKWRKEKRKGGGGVYAVHWKHCKFEADFFFLLDTKKLLAISDSLRRACSYTIALAGVPTGSKKAKLLVIVAGIINRSGFILSSSAWNKSKIKQV